MSEAFARAQILRSHHRHEEAVAMLLSHLAQSPDHADAFIELALNRSAISGQEKQALADARTAAGLAPDRAFPLSLQARILSSMNRPGEALPLAEQAIAMAPEVAYYWNTLSIVRCDLKQWREGENAARQALELDPDDGAASNLLSLALRSQKRMEESVEESRRRLTQDPESSFPFFNLGHSAMLRKEFSAAEAYFTEGLRLNPDYSGGMEMLRSAVLSRSRIFRAFMAWTKISEEVLIRRPLAGIVVLMAVVTPLGTQDRAFAPLVVLASAIAYLSFFGVWLRKPFGNFVLWRSGYSSIPLERAERNEAITVVSGFAVGWLIVALGAFAGLVGIEVIGLGLWVSSAASIDLMTSPAKGLRRISASLTGLFLALTGYFICIFAADPHRKIEDDALAGGVLLAWFGVVFFLLIRNPYFHAKVKRWR